MSLRLEMLQVARVAPKVLGGASELVQDFLGNQQNPDGGFKDREGKSDLYYTVFGMDALAVFQQKPNLGGVEKFLLSFGEGEGLDLVHLSCLIRCWGTIGRDRMPKNLRAALLKRLEDFRKPCGGWDNSTERDHGTAYGSFLALGAYQDMANSHPSLCAFYRASNNWRPLITRGTTIPTSPSAPPTRQRAQSFCLIIYTCPLTPRSANGCGHAYIHRAGLWPCRMRRCRICFPQPRPCMRWQHWKYA